MMFLFDVYHESSNDYQCQQNRARDNVNPGKFGCAF